MVVSSWWYLQALRIAQMNKAIANLHNVIKIIRFLLFGYKFYYIIITTIFQNSENLQAKHFCCVKSSVGITKILSDVIKHVIVCLFSNNRTIGLINLQLRCCWHVSQISRAITVEAVLAKSTLRSVF